MSTRIEPDRWGVLAMSSSHIRQDQSHRRLTTQRFSNSDPVSLALRQMHKDIQDEPIPEELQS
jgi:hypothetical protein